MLSTVNRSSIFPISAFFSGEASDLVQLPLRVEGRSQAPSSFRDLPLLSRLSKVSSFSPLFVYVILALWSSILYFGLSFNTILFYWLRLCCQAHCCVPCGFSILLLLGTTCCSRLIIYFPCLSPRITHFFSLLSFFWFFETGSCCVALA
jgi:hypothetical protein